MDVFALRQNLIRDYATYVQSFIHIADKRIRREVDRRAVSQCKRRVSL